MARIYYHEEKISGQAFQNEIINLQLFDFIFDNTNTDKFNIQPAAISSFFRLIKSKKHTFKTVRISRDGTDYQTRKGSFYLPQAIIFYEKNDFDFPSEFYFIAKLKDKLEIRKCNGGKTVKWFQIPDLHVQVTDPKIVQKIENTLLEIKKLVATTHNKHTHIDIGKKEEKATIEETRPFLNKSVKDAYKELTEICISNNSKKKDVIEFIERLKNHDKDSKYLTTLNFVMAFFDQNKISFILRLDWKAGIEDLEWVLKLALKDNFDLSFDLPGPNDYDKNVSVSSDSVFKDFNEPLKKNGLQMGFIDTQSDEYVFLLHKIEDKEKIKKGIHEIGYNYYEK